MGYPPLRQGPCEYLVQNVILPDHGDHSDVAVAQEKNPGTSNPRGKLLPEFLRYTQCFH